MPAQPAPTSSISSAGNLNLDARAVTIIHQRLKDYSNVTCAVLTPIDLCAREQASRFLDLLLSNSWVAPSYIGNEEPIETLFTGKSEAEDRWEEPFLWKNNRLEGSVW